MKRGMGVVPSDGLLVWYVPEWMKEYLRRELRRLRRFERKRCLAKKPRRAGK